MSDREQRVDEAIAAYYQAHEAGSPMTPEQLAAAHPDLEGELRSFLDAEGVLRRVTPASEQETLGPAGAAGVALGTVRYFGDYELVEEIARGGMGVVYRARQVSLNRV